MLLSSLHLRQYTEEMFRQEQAAKTGLLQEKSMMASQRSTFRSTQLTKMEAVRGDKMKKLQRDDAVHATLLQHKVRWELTYGIGGWYLSDRRGGFMQIILNEGAS